LVRCAAALLTEVQDLPDGAIHSRPSDLRDTGSSNPGALHTGPGRSTLGSKY
jgi:nicotinate-nucleotide--dimethylbenzimidazole phosphoribosyltransferase